MSTATVIQADAVTKEQLDTLHAAKAAMPQGSPIEVLLTNLLTTLANGEDFAGLPVDADCTPAQAAKLLNVSRPFVYGLMDRGVLRFHNVGKDRRIHVNEVLDYIDRRERASAQLARDLASSEDSLAARKNAAAPLTQDLLELVDAL